MATAPRSSTPRSSEQATPGVTIGLREIYDKVADVAGQITHLSALVSGLQSSHTETDTKAAGLEARVRQLETRPVVTPAAMWTALGVLATVAGALVTFLAFVAR